MFLEALHNYSILAYVVRKDGMLTKFQNVVLGWTGSIAVVLIICSLCYEDYGARYHCWLQMDTKLIYGQLVPIAVLWIITLTLIEAAGSATAYRKLPGIDEEQYLSGEYEYEYHILYIDCFKKHIVS